jgi:two-component system cell cycle sensor histidine kinase/response regulator CckA
MRDADRTKDQLIGELAAARQHIAELEAAETQRRRAERALEDLLRTVERAKQEWESTADSVPVLVCLVDQSGRIIRANRAVETWDLARVEEVSGRGFHELLHPHCADAHCYLDGLWKDTREQQGTDRLAECEVYDQILGRHVLARMQPCGYRGEGPATDSTVVVLCDTTERRRAEAQREQLQAHLLRAQKMEAVGRLASGVAHDFINLLTAITGYGQLLMRALDTDDPRRMDVQRILDTSQQATLLTDQLLALGRRQVRQLQVLDLNDLVTDLEKMLQCLGGTDFQLNTVLDSALRPVRVDPGQMRQVIMNLAVNAKDAMPQGGSLTLRTENMARSEGQGPLVRLSVADTGVGMDEQVLQHLFEPFFTTKVTGTGLGLSTVYGIVEQHNGWIEVDSKPGQGSTFDIYLPALSAYGHEFAQETVSLQEPSVPLPGASLPVPG